MVGSDEDEKLKPPERRDETRLVPVLVVPGLDWVVDVVLSGVDALPVVVVGDAADVVTG